MSTYEPCVLGSDGNCTRWSHDHAADRPPVTDYPDASKVLDVIYEVGHAASSTVQRRLGLTFRQAEDVLTALGRCGVVGKAKGSAARKILVTRPEAEAILGMDDPEAMAPEAPAQAHPRPSVTDDASAEQSEMLVDAAAIPTALLAVGRAETTTEAVERIARQIARETAMTGRDALELVEAVQALQDAETTTATVEVAEEVLHGAGWFARADLDPRDLRGILWDLSDAGLLATTRTRPTREELSTLILSFLKPPKHSGGSWTLNPDDAADAVLALFRGGDK